MTLKECLKYVASNFDAIQSDRDKGNQDAALIMRAIELVDKEGMDWFYVSAFCVHTEKYMKAKG